MKDERLQKYIAKSGFASRRKAEDMIKEGRVTVNGKVITEMGFKLGSRDKVIVDDIEIREEKKKYYILLNKPKRVVTSAKDDRGRVTVIDLIKGIDARLYPVGRLDYDSEGLILITNDGDFANKISHPSSEIWKTYEVILDGKPKESDINAFDRGIVLDGQKTSPAVLEIIDSKKLDSVLCEVVIKEGKNRQVRRMFEKRGFRVRKLVRTKIGALELENLPEGKWRYLEEEDFLKLV